MFQRGQSYPTGRFQELLDSLSAEHQALEQEVNTYKRQVSDYEKKFDSQIQELSSMQNTLFELEQVHQKIKMAYQDEIDRLRRQIEMQSSDGGQQLPPAKKQRVDSMPEPPPTSSVSSGAFSHTLPGSVPSLGTSLADKRAFEPKQTFGLQPLAVKSTAPSQFPSMSMMGGGSGSGSGSDLPVAHPPPPAPPTATTGVGGASSLPAFSSLGAKDQQQQQSLSSSLPLPPPPSTATPSEHSAMPQGPQQPVVVKAEESAHGHHPIAPTASVSDVDMLSGGGGGGKAHAPQDWVVVYNTSVKTNVSINLMHTLEHDTTTTSGASGTSDTAAAQQQQPGATRHEVCCVRFSHDGRYLATGSNRIAQIFDVESGLLTCSLAEKGHSAEGSGDDLYVRSVCFSPDGACLATGAEDKTVKVWDIATRSVRHALLGHELDIYSLDWSSDGAHIASGSGDGRVKLWAVATGQCVHTLGSEETGPREGVTSVAFSNDGTMVAAGSLDCVVRVWEVATGRFVAAFEGHDDSVYSVAFSPDGKTLASGSLDKTLKLWDVTGTKPEKCLLTLVGHKNYVLSVAFSPDGKWLVSGSKDQSLQFWDPKTGAVHLMLQGHKNSVISVAMNPKQPIFATGSGDFRARLWRFETGLLPEDTSRSKGQ